MRLEICLQEYSLKIMPLLKVLDGGMKHFKELGKKWTHNTFLCVVFDFVLSLM